MKQSRFIKVLGTLLVLLLAVGCGGEYNDTEDSMTEENAAVEEVEELEPLVVDEEKESEDEEAVTEEAELDPEPAALEIPEEELVDLTAEEAAEEEEVVPIEEEPAVEEPVVEEAIVEEPVEEPAAEEAQVVETNLSLQRFYGRWITEEGTSADEIVLEVGYMPPEEILNMNEGIEYIMVGYYGSEFFDRERVIGLEPGSEGNILTMTVSQMEEYWEPGGITLIDTGATRQYLIETVAENKLILTYLSPEGNREFHYVTMQE